MIYFINIILADLMQAKPRAVHAHLVLPCSGCFGNPETGVQDVKEAETAHWEDHVEDNPGVLVYCLTQGLTLDLLDWQADALPLSHLDCVPLATWEVFEVSYGVLYFCLPSTIAVCQHS